MKDVMRYSLINSIGTAIYIILIVFFISSLDGSVIDGEKETLLTPIFILMLFVFSAAFTGILVFGRPIVWYLDGKKKEAISLLFHTLGIFLVITFIAFIFLISMLN